MPYTGRGKDGSSGRTRFSFTVEKTKSYGRDGRNMERPVSEPAVQKQPAAIGAQALPVSKDMGKIENWE
jgi:hypothetical protein